MHAHTVGWQLAAVLVVSVLLTACFGGDGEGEATSSLFSGTDGAALYAQACGGCHGEDLRGTDEGPPFLNVIYRSGHHADISFFLAVRDGARSHHWNFGDMPPVQGLTEEQVASIVAFVRGRQVEAGIE